MEHNEATICPLCRQESVTIFAFGECLHMICHVCSTKMRVLCEQTYCAICRQDLSKVYFVPSFTDVRLPIEPSAFKPIDGTGDCGIFYSKKAEWIRIKTENLLRNFCPICSTEFETLEILREHVQKSHRLFYCDLCVEHLNLFPYERKCYTRRDLLQHVRNGDRDDKSFKGHPMCKFCEDNFLDNDHLYRHMRQEHYYCHLCSNDNVYYSTIELLRLHHRNDHYLCEIGQCKSPELSNVFATEIEFRAHQSSQHSKTRAEARQLGTIPVEFQLTNTNDRRRQQQQQKNNTSRENNAASDTRTDNESQTERKKRDDSQQIIENVPTIDQFPALASQNSSTSMSGQQRGAWGSDNARGIYSNEDFPALSSAHGSSNNLLQSRGIWRESQNQSTASGSSTTTQVVSATKNTQKKNTPSVQSATGTGSAMNVEEEFPQLKSSGGTRIVAPNSSFSAWSMVKKNSKQSSASSNTYRPQTRINIKKIMSGADEDDDCIRRPMSTLMTSTAPATSSNITMISSSDFNTAPVNDKTNKNKKQSVPNLQDFPELPLTSLTNRGTKAPVPVSGAWVSDASNTTETKTVTSKQEKKKKGNMSKREFLDEIRRIPPPTTAIQSKDDQPVLGLSDLGRRLIDDEPQSEQSSRIHTETKSVENPSPVKKDEEEKPVTPSKKNKKGKKNVNNDSNNTQEQSEQIQFNIVLPSTTATTTQEQYASLTGQEKQKTLPSSTSNRSISSSTKSVPIETAPVITAPSPPITADLPPPPPPGFATSSQSISPPPGFSTNGTIKNTNLTFILPSDYTRKRGEFQTKLYYLFDQDMCLIQEYDKFCEAYSQNSITTDDFFKFTKELLKDKLEEYLLELITILPNIEKQIELYEIWTREIQTNRAASDKNWTKKAVEKRTIHQCHLCQQIMFDSDSEEHSSHHPQFNTEFPSLPSATIPLGQAKGKQKK